MNLFIRYSATFLLLLFMRVMVPDAVLINIHHHAHTEHTAATDEKQSKVEQKHQHCPVDQLFDSPYQGTQQPAFTSLIQLTSPVVALISSSWQADVFDLKHQRGPPVIEFTPRIFC